MDRSAEPGPRGRHRRGDRAIARSAAGGTLTSVALILAALAVSWIITYLLGGSKSFGPQLFYAPILFAATRFGHGGALVTAIAAGLLGGPVMPLDVDQGLDQQAENWVGRLGAFVVIGQVVAALHLRSMPSVQHRIEARHFRQRLDRALADGMIRPVYQPLVDLHTGHIIGIEALARWHEPDGRMSGPNDFIPDAEAADVVTLIDLEMLRQAAVQLAAWRSTVLADRPEVFVSVNFSGRAFDDGQLTARVVSVVDAAGLRRDSVLIEVTETALIADHDLAATRMDELRAAGVRLALDDFGSGQSSLAALHRFPVDVVKLDRAFVGMLDDDATGPDLFEAVIHLAERLSFGMVITEGIETPSQLHGVVASGCRFGQGVLFDQPLDGSGAERALGAGAYHLPSPPRGRRRDSDM